MKFLEILGLLWQAIVAWWNDNAMRLGASVAYYTLFAIAPILLVAIAVAGSLFGAEAVRGEIVGQIDQLVGTEGGKAVQALLQGATRKEENILAVTIGGITFVLAACGAFLELQAALDAIWRVKPAPSEGQLKAFFLDRLRSFGLVVAIGFLLLVSLAVNAALAAFSAWLETWAPAMPVILYALNFLLSVAVTATLFGAAVQVPPRRRAEVARCRDRRNRDGVAVCGRQAHHRSLPRPEQHDVELWRCRFSDRPPAVGVLLVPDSAYRRRVHAALQRTGSRLRSRRRISLRRPASLRRCDLSDELAQAGHVSCSQHSREAHQLEQEHIMKVLGGILVVLGIIAILYGGISWTRRDTVVDAGPIQITADKKESIPISPIAGGLMLVAGVALLLKRGA